MRTVRLDDYVASEGISRITGIKIDIEGAEERALQGMSVTLRTLRPSFLMMELNRQTLAMQGTTPAKLAAQMSTYGYHPYQLRGRRLIRLGASRSGGG